MLKKKIPGPRVPWTRSSFRIGLEHFFKQRTRNLDFGNFGVVESKTKSLRIMAPQGLIQSHVGIILEALFAY